MEKKLWSLQIPSTFLFDKKINSTEKILLSLILSLSNDTGYCYATNSYFADVLNMNKVAISNLLATLEQREYITRVVERNERKQIVKRLIKIKIDIPINKKMNRPTPENSNDPINENMKGNSILINKVKISI